MAVHEALLKRLPDSADTLQSNSDELIADLVKLDNSFREATAELEGRPLFASHPVYQYLARRYGLSLESFHWEPDVVPDAHALAELESKREEHPASVMIWEGPPAAESVRLLDDLGIRSIVISPGGNRPSEGDWLSLMKKNLAVLQALSAASP